MSNSLDERLSGRGYSTVAEFLSARPGVGYVTLGDDLGVLPITLIRAHLEEARDAGLLREAARDALARQLREGLPRGWSPSDEMGNIAPWSAWSSYVDAAGGPAQAVRLSVYDALKARAPDGWIPRDASDPILRAAFDAGWPEP